jgi:ComF family protein
MICPECEQPAVAGMTHLGCQHPLGVNGLISVWAYEGVVRKAIAELKFRFVREISADLVKGVLSEAGINPNLMFSLRGGEVVWTGIPLHPLRQNWRGFNQVDGITQALATFNGGQSTENLLKRSEFVPPQVGLSEKERQKNVRGKFRVTNLPGYPKVVLVDDVWTTGSTMKEAVKILKQAGVGEVWGFTLAR